MQHKQFFKGFPKDLLDGLSNSLLEGSPKGFSEGFSASLCALILGLSLPASAQVMPPQTMLNTLSRHCNRATEVSYRSHQLISPDGRIHVHAEGLLRKIVDPSSPLRQTDTNRTCYSDMRHTVARHLVIETESESYRLVDEPYAEGYVLYQPRAFSANSQFLALEMQIAYTHANPGSYVIFMNAENDETVQIRNMCGNLGFQSYIGFLSDREAAVHCRNNRATVEWFEAVDLSSGQVRQLSSRPEAAASYGRVVGEFEVVKTQIFR